MAFLSDPSNGEVLVLAFLSHLSNLWLWLDIYFVLDMAFFHLFCL